LVKTTRVKATNDRTYGGPGLHSLRKGKEIRFGGLVGVGVGKSRSHKRSSFGGC